MGNFYFSRPVARVVLICFFVTNLFWGIPTQTFAQDAATVKPSAEQALVPQALGSIEKQSGGKTKAPIFYIQDAHGSLEAQQNIAKLIDHLVKAQGVKTLYVEGFEGPLPLDTLFADIKDAKTKEKVSAFLMDYLRLNGAQYAYVNRTQDFDIIGIESREDYLANLKAYDEAAGDQKTIASDLADISKQLSQLADRIYPKEIKTFLKLKERFTKKELSLADYIFRSMKIYYEDGTVTDSRYPNLKIISDNLSKKELSAAERKELNAKLAAIDSKIFFEELTRFENDLTAKYLKDPAAQTTFHYQEGIELLRRLNQLELTPDEFTRLNNYKDLDTVTIAHFLAKNLKKTLVLSNEWEKLAKNSKLFYELAQKRDQIFQEKLAVAAQNPTPSILVTGGFHKGPVTRFFETQGIGYVLIAPRISQPDPKHEERYEYLMTNEYYDYEKPFFAGNAAEKMLLQKTIALFDFSAVKALIDQIAELFKTKPASEIVKNLGGTLPGGLMAGQGGLGRPEPALVPIRVKGQSLGADEAEADFKVVSAKIHMRPVQQLVRAASKHEAHQINLEISGSETADMKSTLDMLAVLQELSRPGTQFIVKVTGPKADEALEALRRDILTLRDADENALIEFVPPAAKNLDASASTQGKSLGYSEAELAKAAAYYDGKLKTTPIRGKYRPSREDDVTKISEITQDERRELIALAVRSLALREGEIGVVAAGGSTRMNVKDAPVSVTGLIEGRALKAKGAVPIGIKDGKVYTYYGAFLTNVRRLQRQISKKVEFPIDLNVLILSNDEYRPELDQELAANNNFGLSPSQLDILNQTLGNQFVATPQDVEKLYKAGKITEERYREALAIALSAESEYKKGNREALILPDEKVALGHGEFLHQLVSSGMLLKLIQNGRKWISVRNIDNVAAALDENWLTAIGLFLKNNLDMQPEVSPRSKGQKGGSLIVKETGNQELAEDPSIAVSKDNNLEPEASSFWFNDAVASAISIRYIISIYKKSGQTDSDFIAEMKQATPSELEAIADRGRAKFPVLLDPKPAKSSNAVATKVETNMWQSTGVIGEDVKVRGVGVTGVKNIDIEKFLKLSAAEQLAAVKNLRMLATKQWQMSDKEKAALKEDFKKIFGREPTEAELLVGTESYEGNKFFAPLLLKHITESNFIPDDVKISALSLGQVPAADLAVPIKFGTSGWRAVEAPSGSFKDAGFTIENVSRVAQAVASEVKAGTPAGVQPRLAVGFDSRTGARESAMRVVEVLTANGIHADLIDQVTPTPIMAEATRGSLPPDQRYDLAIHLTASHNPVFFDLEKKEPWLGLKVLASGVPAPDSLTQAIANRANDASSNAVYTRIPYDQIPAELTTRGVDLITQSNERLRKAFDFDSLKSKIQTYKQTHPEFGMIIDSMYGATADAAKIFQELGVVDAHLNTGKIRDGQHPVSVTDSKTGKSVIWAPEPRPLFHPELTAQMKPGKMGLPLDGDGDRAAFFDIDGKTTLTPNQLGLIFAHYLYNSKGVRGPVVRTLPTTRSLDRFAKRNDLKLVETPVGSKHFAPYAVDSAPEKLLVGIEESGHVFFQLNGEVFADSAVAEGLLALDILVTTGKSLTEYLAEIEKEQGTLIYNRGAFDPKSVPDFEKFKTALAKLRTENPKDFSVALARLLKKKLLLSADKKTLDKVSYDTTDAGGILVRFADDTWAMYRLSGTDGSVRIYGEESTPERLADQEKAVSKTLIDMTSSGQSLGAQVLAPLREKPVVTVVSLAELNRLVEKQGEEAEVVKLFLGGYIELVVTEMPSVSNDLLPKILQEVGEAKTRLHLVTGVPTLESLRKIKGIKDTLDGIGAAKDRKVIYASDMAAYQTDNEKIMSVKTPYIGAAVASAAGDLVHLNAFIKNKATGFWEPTELGRFLMSLVQDFLSDQVVAQAA